ncbi:MAG TPA: cob(I)yrinic acid a,c-diamide adenosyltransferase [Firmicutes bacterium]|nr:cob(I)yrinic acid a,c-diamide adenosyltransferase [Bacillota bacterium]
MAGLLHIYCGDGKGKTTAALGLALRAHGAGKQVVVVQFLKSLPTGELASLKELGIPVLRGNLCGKFFSRMTDDEKKQTLASHQQIFHEAQQRCLQAGNGLLILDELSSAYRYGMIEQKEVLHFLDHRPQELEVVITGRDPAPELLARADYISEVVKKKHPYDLGITAREGIEY